MKPKKDSLLKKIMKKRQEHESLFEEKEIIHVIEDLLSLLGPVKYSLTLVLLVLAGFFLLFR